VRDAATTSSSYRLLRPLGGVQSGASFLGVRCGADGFEKPVVVYFAARESAESVIKEAKRAACLSHRCIAPVLDAGTASGRPFVVCDYVPGITLLRFMRCAPSWSTVAYIVSEAARALAYAHARRDEGGRLLRIVHRRISPHRIEVTESGHVRVTGFGSSWAWPDPRGYGAPEERRREPVDGRADVYSLGLMLQRLCPPSAESLEDIITEATRPLQEMRSTADQLHRALVELLADTGQVPHAADLARLVTRCDRYSTSAGSGSASCASSPTSLVSSATTSASGSSISDAASASAAAAASASAASASAASASASAAAS
jgi:serine/threonine protein kinase